MLTAEQLAKRGEIGASDVPTIVNGTAEQLNAKWRQLVGLDPPEDLSNNWPVQQGSHMEPFILDWHQRKLGYPLEERGEVLRHPRLDFVTCTLDAYDRTRDAVIDSKCTAWSLDWATQFYTPQLLIQRDCKAASMAIMLVSVGGREPEEVEIEFDQDYYDEMIARIEAFKICMETMTPPVALPRLVAPEEWRTVNLDTEETNYKAELIEHLEVWAGTKDAAAVHEETAGVAKSLVPEDVGRLYFRDIVIRRNKKGHLSLRSRTDE
jgi:predicted phage-related endonuclease